MKIVLLGVFIVMIVGFMIYAIKKSDDKELEILDDKEE